MSTLLLLIGLQIVFVLALVFRNRHAKKPLTNNRIALLAGLCLYVSLMITVLVTAYMLKSELNSFDLDGDGSFSGIEVTPAQREVMFKVISDTGRNLAPVTGLVYSTIFYVLVLVLLTVFNRKRKSAENVHCYDH